MKTAPRLAQAAYGRLLRLYPPDFREEFEAEMQAVFGQAAQDAAGRGWAALAGLCWREARDWPAAVLRAHWRSRARRVKLTMGTPLPTRSPGQPEPGTPGSPLPGTWRTALLAGLPHGLTAVLVALGWLLSAVGVTLPASLVLALILSGAGLALAGAVIVAWRNAWPRWWASWASYLFLAAVGLLLQPLQSWPALMRWQSLSFVLVIPLLAAGALLWAARRDPLGGLLIALPLVLCLWAPVTEFIPGSLGGPLWLAAFLLAAVTAAAMVRLNNVRLAVWLGLGLSLVVGALAAYLRTYWHYVLPEYPLTPTFPELVELFTPQWVASATLIIGPLLAWGVWQLGQAGGRAGRLAAGVLIAGGVLNLAGHLAYTWRALDHFSGPAAWLILGQAWPPLVANSGLVMVLAGAAWLSWQTWHKEVPLGGAWGLVIGLVAVGLPLMFMLPTYFGYRINAAGLWFGFYNLGTLQKDLVFAVGLAWLLLGGWLVARLSSLAAATWSGDAA